MTQHMDGSASLHSDIYNLKANQREYGFDNKDIDITYALLPKFYRSFNMVLLAIF